jgi:hypothetical protein
MDGVKPTTNFWPVLVPAPRSSLPSLYSNQGVTHPYVSIPLHTPRLFQGLALPVAATVNPLDSVQGGADGATVSVLLSSLLDKVDSLSADQTSLAQENRDVKARLADQRALAQRQQAEIQRLRQTQTNSGSARGQIDDRSRPETVSVPSHNGRSDWNGDRFCAVAKGRTTGIFTRWRDAERSVKGYSGAIFKRFRSEPEALRWLDEQGWAQYVDNASDISVNNTQFDHTVYEPQRATAAAPTAPEPIRPTGLTLPVTDVIDLTQVGPDTSIGKPMEVHGTLIQVETEILQILCPKGMTNAAKKELMEASPDVLSLPGKLGSATNDTAEVMDQFAGGVNDITNQRAARTGVQSRDMQWKGATRNALDKIKTAEDLSEAAEEISSQSDSVYQSFEGSVREILYNQGWAKADVDLYLAAGLLPRIVQRTLFLYYELYSYFQKLVNKNPDPEHFKSFILLHVTYHASQLRNIRTYSTRRGLMILRSYTYLRDAKAKGFTDITLVGQVVETTLFATVSLDHEPKDVVRTIALRL